MKFVQPPYYVNFNWFLITIKIKMHMSHKHMVELLLKDNHVFELLLQDSTTWLNYYYKAQQNG